MTNHLFQVDVLQPPTTRIQYGHLLTLTGVLSDEGTQEHERKGQRFRICCLIKEGNRKQSCYVIFPLLTCSNLTLYVVQKWINFNQGLGYTLN